jgi:hypothetical protein
LHLILQLLLLLGACRFLAAWSCCISHMKALLASLRQHYLRLTSVLLLLLALQTETQNPWCRAW